MKTKWLIYSFIACTIPLGFWAVSTLKLETNLYAYHLAADADIVAYESFASDLGRKKSDETLLILEKATGWNSFEDFQQLESVVAFWKTEPGIKKASAITDLMYPKKGFFGPQTEPFLDLVDRERFQKRMNQFDRFPDIFGKFISSDKKYALVFVDAQNGISQQSVQRLEQLSAFRQGLEVHYLQYDLIQNELQASLRHDTIWLACISLCLILIGFYAFTGSLSGLGLIALMVAFNNAATFLVMYVLSMPFTLPMINIPCMITVLSFSDIMHILYHQQKALPTSGTRSELQQKIIAEVRAPLFLTSLTNMVGFLIFLLFSKNVHLHNFSLAAIAGVVIAYLSARFLVIPLMDKDFVFIKRNNFQALYSIHKTISHWCWSRKNMVLPTFLLVTALLLVFVGSRLSIDDSDQAYELTDSKLTRGKEILQQAFFGAKQAEVLITCKEGIVWDKAILDQMAQIEAAIDSHFQPLFINSPGVLVKRYHRYLINGHPAAYLIPARLDSNDVAQLNEYRSQLGGDGIVDSTAKKASIVFGFNDLKLPAARKAYQQLRDVLARQNNAAVRYELSGLQYLSDEATYQFSLKILLGLLLSIVSGSVLVFFYLHSIRKSIGVLLVNLFPMCVALGMMIIWELPISPLTLFFLSILLGVCVDDSIYLIARHRKGHHSLHVVPIFITSFVLSLGFLSLAFSSFGFIKPFGWIFVLGIVLAYLSDLFVLPFFLNRKPTFGADG